MILVVAQMTQIKDYFNLIGWNSIMELLVLPVETLCEWLHYCCKLGFGNNNVELKQYMVMCVELSVYFLHQSRVSR